METDVKPKKRLSLRRVMVLSVVVALAAAAFATLALISTNLAQAQEGGTPLQPGTPIPPTAGGAFNMAVGGPVVLDMAVDQGIITAEQAEQIRAKLPEVILEAVGAGGWASAGPLGDFEPLNIETALQNAVTEGQITQAEADEILAELAAGTLEFLAITDEGVFTDPENLPEGVIIGEGHASVEGSGMAIVIQNGGEGLPMPNFAVPAHPDAVMAPFAAGLDSAIAEAVSEGIITQEQADQLLALAPEMGGHMVFRSAIAHGGLATPLLPHDWLLALVNEALQDAAADGKITSEQANSLHQQLSDALSE